MQQESAARTLAARMSALFRRVPGMTHRELIRQAAAQHQPIQLKPQTLSGWFNEAQPVVPRDFGAVKFVVTYLHGRLRPAQPLDLAAWRRLWQDAWNESHTRPAGRPRKPASPAAAPAGEHEQVLGRPAVAALAQWAEAASVELPRADGWNLQLLLRFRREIEGSERLESRGLEHMVDCLARALRAAEAARAHIPGALAGPSMQLALHRVLPTAGGGPFDTDIDYLSHVATHHPVSARNADEILVAFLMWACHAEGVDPAPLLPWAYANTNPLFVNDTLRRIKQMGETANVRLIIGLHGSPTDGWPEETHAWLMHGGDLVDHTSSGEHAPDRHHCELAVARLLRWGQAAAATRGLPLRHIDLVPPARHVLQWRPEESILGGVLGSDFETVVRWSHRLNRPPDMNGGLHRAIQRQEGSGPPAIEDWLQRHDADDAVLRERLDRHPQSTIGLAFQPDSGHELLALLLDYTPILLWPQTGSEVNDLVCQDLASRWVTLPRGFAEAYRHKRRTDAKNTIAELRSLWDDPEWLRFCLQHA